MRRQSLQHPKRVLPALNALRLVYLIPGLHRSNLLIYGIRLANLSLARHRERARGYRQWRQVLVDDLIRPQARGLAYDEHRPLALFGLIGIAPIALAMLLVEECAVHAPTTCFSACSISRFCSSSSSRSEPKISRNFTGRSASEGPTLDSHQSCV